jgi:hypothetical protein
MENDVCGSNADKNVFVTGEVAPDYLYAPFQVGRHNLAVSFGRGHQRDDLEAITAFEENVEPRTPHVARGTC